MEVVVHYKCLQGAGDKLDDQLSPWIPPHERSETVCFSDLPPAGVLLIAERLTWLVIAAGVFKFSGLSDYTKGFFSEMGKKTAEILSGVLWDDEKKTFRGLFVRVKRAIGGPDEPTNAEEILRQASQFSLDSGQEVYLLIGLPVPSIREGTLWATGNSVSDTEICLDTIALAVLTEEAVRRAATWVTSQWPEIRLSGIRVEPQQAGFRLYWCPSGNNKMHAQHFDWAGVPVGDIQLY